MNYRSYKELQDKESAFSRGTMYGDRLEREIEILEHFFKGDVLVVGCNDGRGMEKIQSYGHKVTGIDISPNKIREAKKHGLDVIEGEMEELPFKDKEFNTVFCSHTLEHSRDITTAISELKRVGDRRLIIIVPIENENRQREMKRLNIWNEAHLSPIKSKEYLKELVGEKVLFEESSMVLEPEYKVVFDLWESY